MGSCAPPPPPTPNGLPAFGPYVPKILSVSSLFGVQCVMALSDLTKKDKGIGLP